MTTTNLQPTRLRRRVATIIERGQQPRDLAHLLADLERRQVATPGVVKDDESVSSDSSGDGSSSGPSSDSEAGAPKTSPAPTPTPPTLPGQGALIVPFPATVPSTLVTSTTRATTSTQMAVASSQTPPVPSAVSAIPPALNLPLPVPSSVQQGLLSGGVLATTTIGTSAGPAATSAGVSGSLNSGDSASIVGNPSAAGILAGSIAGIFALAGAGVYFYRRRRRASEESETESQAGFAKDDRDDARAPGGRSSESRNPLWRSFFSSTNTNSVAPPRNSEGPVGFTVQNEESQLDRMTALDEKQFAAYKNLMGAGK